MGNQRPVTDKGGKPISDEEGQKKRWMEHFEELLNRSAPQDPPDISPASDDLPVDCDPPTKKEIYQAIKQQKNDPPTKKEIYQAIKQLKNDPPTKKEIYQAIKQQKNDPPTKKEIYQAIKQLKNDPPTKKEIYQAIKQLKNDPPTKKKIYQAIKQLKNDPPTKKEMYQAIKQQKNGKSVEPGSIPAEALKTDIETSVGLLYPLINKIWEEEQVPSEWKEGYLIKLPKKDDLSSCSNYRGITLHRQGVQSSATEQDERCS